MNLSGKVSYGSGFPIPGFFRREGGTYYLSSERNTVRLDPYERVDFRVNKEHNFHHGKMTFYAEVAQL